MHILVNNALKQLGFNPIAKKIHKDYKTLLQGILEDPYTGERVGPIRVAILTSSEAKALHPHSSRPHRVYFYCPKCNKFTPLGRLYQHMKKCIPK